MFQDKAQHAVNGAPLTRAVTQYCNICRSPFGRHGKPSSAVLRPLRRGLPFPAERALQLTAYHGAEYVKQYETLH